MCKYFFSSSIFRHLKSDHLSCWLCDKPLTLEEIKNAINLLNNDNSPDTDGPISEFYKSFANELASFLSVEKKTHHDSRVDYFIMLKLIIYLHYIFVSK